ncbi:hypothetical protein M3Y94_00482500 [Aphelenchoides besseyi]|nr:hypothetical protein M3Y94_00482500 [Aphelenchoides besseyi]KAI6217433.1 hypothetical protein M3Y95_01218500 [Aphelenchoides besseyi]
MKRSAEASNRSDSEMDVTDENLNPQSSQQQSSQQQSSDQPNSVRSEPTGQSIVAVEISPRKPTAVKKPRFTQLSIVDCINSMNTNNTEQGGDESKNQKKRSAEASNRSNSEMDVSDKNLEPQSSQQQSSQQQSSDQQSSDKQSSDQPNSVRSEPTGQSIVAVEISPRKPTAVKKSRLVPSSIYHPQNTKKNTNKVGQYEQLNRQKRLTKVISRIAPEIDGFSENLDTQFCDQPNSVEIPVWTAPPDQVSLTVHTTNEMKQRDKQLNKQKRLTKIISRIAPEIDVSDKNLEPQSSQQQSSQQQSSQQQSSDQPNSVRSEPTGQPTVTVEISPKKPIVFKKPRFTQLSIVDCINSMNTNNTEQGGDESKNQKKRSAEASNRSDSEMDVTDENLNPQSPHQQPSHQKPLQKSSHQPNSVLSERTRRNRNDAKH